MNKQVKCDQQSKTKQDSRIATKCDELEGHRLKYVLWFFREFKAFRVGAIKLSFNGISVHLHMHHLDSYSSKAQKKNQ